MGHRAPVILNADGPPVEGPSESSPPEHLAALLKRSMDLLRVEFFDTAAGRVRYEAMPGSAAFAAYCGMAVALRGFPLASLRSDPDRLAFWINMYNALVIHGIIALGLRQSVWEAGPFFRRVRYLVGGQIFSLDDIEHGILRGNRRGPSRLRRQFRAAWGRLPFPTSDPRLRFRVEKLDPRIHCALVCGSRSCPPIEAYHPQTIDEELDIAAAHFVNSRQVEVRPAEDCLVLSRIFSWYRRDFEEACGSLPAFLLRYLLDPAARDYLATVGERVRIRFTPYDWSPNAA